MRYWARILKTVSIFENLQCDGHDYSRRGQAEPRFTEEKTWFGEAQQLTQGHSERQGWGSRLFCRTPWLSTCHFFPRRHVLKLGQERIQAASLWPAGFSCCDCIWLGSRALGLGRGLWSGPPATADQAVLPYGGSSWLHNLSLEQLRGKNLNDRT